MANDERQEKLRRLYGELRLIKQCWLPVRLTDPVSQALHDEIGRKAIRRIDERIEEEINAQE